MHSLVHSTNIYGLSPFRQKPMLSARDKRTKVSNSCYHGASRLLDETEPKQTDPSGEGTRQGSAEEGGVAEADLFQRQPQPYLGLLGPQ